VILPTLADRPRAWLDWLEFQRSVLGIDAPHRWAVARAYLVDTLADRVHTGQPFNKFDHDVLQTALSHNASHVVASAGGGARMQPPAPPGRDRLPWVGECSEGVCRNYNIGQCYVNPCPYRHECMWRACPTPTDGHRGPACSKKPASFSVLPPPRPPGRGGAASRPPPGAERRR
jgi:hypothetical protein